MDASQYKDYVLFMLFIKYVSDKYGDSDDFAPPVTIPLGASFMTCRPLRGRVILAIRQHADYSAIDANSRLARSDFPDFNDPNKLGEGKAMVDRLTNLVATLEKPELNFSKTGRTISSATPTNISCGTSPRRAVRARASSIPLLKSAALWLR